MTRSRYKIHDNAYPHFLTCTVVEWLPVFTRQDAVQIVLSSDVMMEQKIEYIHFNPVQRGFVDDPVHWQYSSARNYAGMRGLIDVVTDWT